MTAAGLISALVLALAVGAKSLDQGCLPPNEDAALAVDLVDDPEQRCALNSRRAFVSAVNPRTT
jgi:hypothetical protein